MDDDSRSEIIRLIKREREGRVFTAICVMLVALFAFAVVISCQAAYKSAKCSVSEWRQSVIDEAREGAVTHMDLHESTATGLMNGKHLIDMHIDKYHNGD